MHAELGVFFKGGYANFSGRSTRQNLRVWLLNGDFLARLLLTFLLGVESDKAIRILRSSVCVLLCL